MARKHSHAAIWSQYLALRGVGALLHGFDPEENLQTAGGFGALYHRFGARRRARAEANVARSFPDWSAERVAEVVTESMRHMFRMFMVDAVAMPRLVTADAWPAYVELGPRVHEALAALGDDRPTILVTGHCGNWELLGYFISILGFPLAALARPIDNPLINRYLLGIRQAAGMSILTKWGATSIVPEMLEAGRPVGFIADQNAGDQGLFVPFFGRLASSYKSMGLLAMRHEATIVAGRAGRIGTTMRYRFEMHDLIRPDDWEKREDPLFYVTARIARAIESMIRAAPEQYLWVHRRWKSRPRHERLGRGVPRRLVEQMRSLPWLSEDEIAAVVEDSERLAREGSPP